MSALDKRIWIVWTTHLNKYSCLVLAFSRQKYWHSWDTALVCSSKGSVPRIFEDISIICTSFASISQLENFNNLFLKNNAVNFPCVSLWLSLVLPLSCLNSQYGISLFWCLVQTLLSLVSVSYQYISIGHLGAQTGHHVLLQLMHSWALVYMQLAQQLLECNLDSMTVRHIFTRLCLVFKIIHRDVSYPNPPYTFVAGQYESRYPNSQQLTVQFAWSNYFKSSFFPCTTALWSSLNFDTLVKWNWIDWNTQIQTTDACNVMWCLSCSSYKLILAFSAIFCWPLGLTLTWCYKKV